MVQWLKATRGERQGDVRSRASLRPRLGTIDTKTEPTAQRPTSWYCSGKFQSFQSLEDLPRRRLYCDVLSRRWAIVARSPRRVVGRRRPATRPQHQRVAVEVAEQDGSVCAWNPQKADAARKGAPAIRWRGASGARARKVHGAGPAAGTSAVVEVANDLQSNTVLHRNTDIIRSSCSKPRHYLRCRGRVDRRLPGIRVERENNVWVVDRAGAVSSPRPMGAAAERSVPKACAQRDKSVRPATSRGLARGNLYRYGYDNSRVAKLQRAVKYLMFVGTPGLGSESMPPVHSLHRSKDRAYVSDRENNASRFRPPTASCGITGNISVDQASGSRRKDELVYLTHRHKSNIPADTLAGA